MFIGQLIPSTHERKKSILTYFSLYKLIEAQIMNSGHIEAGSVRKKRRWKVGWLAYPDQRPYQGLAGRGEEPVDPPLIGWGS